MRRKIVRRWIGACVGLAAVGLPIANAQLPTRPASPVYPNLLVEVGKDFANAFTEAQSQTVTVPINQDKDKVHTCGIQTTQIRASVEFIESSQAGRVDMVLTGLTQARTDSQRGRVYLGHNTQISYQSRKTLIIDEAGVHEYLAQTAPHLDMNRLTYLNADFRFPIRPLVKRIAYRAYDKQKPKLNADITQEAGKEFDKQFNEQTAKKIEQVNERYAEDFQKPTRQRGVYPQRIRVLTSDTQLGLRVLLNDPTGKAKTFAPVPDVHGWPDVALRVEESLLNNASQSMFAAKTFNGEELDEEFNAIAGRLIGQVKTTEPGDKPFTITFAKEKPIEFRFYDQKFSITLRGDEYTSGGRDFDAMYTTAVYKLRKTDRGLIAEREGDLKVYPPGFKPGDKLGAREKILQQLLDRKFSKVFKLVFEMKEVKLPDAVKNVGVLVTTQVESNNGWLTLGLRRAPALPESTPAPAVVPAPMPPTQPR